MRDLAYAVRALICFGMREETHAAVSWLLTTIRELGPELHIFCALDGSVPEGTSHPDVPGGVIPAPWSWETAQGQLQLGVYGDLFDVVHAYVDDGNPLDAETGRLLASIADRVCDNWQRPGTGMWELVEHEHYTSSKVGCWQALDFAVPLVELGQLPGGSALRAAERERIRA